MRFCRRSMVSLLPPLVTMSAVTLLLLYFYSDTPPGRLFKPSNSQHLQTRRFSSVSELTLNPHHGQDDARSRKSAILVSLARSGSSFAGDVLSHGPDVYYVFEPLRRTEVRMLQDYRSNTGDPELQAVLLQEWKSQATSILEHFLSCDFSNLDLSLLDFQSLQQYSSTRQLGRCISQHQNGSSLSPQCLQDAERHCSKTKVKIFKVIHHQVHDLEPLLTLHPDLAVILLVRDPRASLWSRLTVFKERVSPSQTKSFLHNLCQRLEEDVSAITELHHRFPTRAKVLHYETLAEQPLSTSQKLYRFLGFPWNPHVQNRIRRQTNSSLWTSSERLETQDYSVVRNDSAYAASRWRSSARWSFVNTVQQECFAVMRQLGYRLFRLQNDLRDTSVGAYSLEDVSIEHDLLLR